MNDGKEKKVFYSREIIGRHIISLDGEDLGSVSRVLVNPETGSVAGLTLNAKGWFKGEKALEFSSVRSFGSYAVTLENKNSVKTLNAFPLLQQLSGDFNLYNIRVITPEGELIGLIEDFAFDTETGNIESLRLSGGLIKKVVQGKAELSVESIEKIGPDVIIAKSGAQDDLVKVDPGITDNFDSLKESISGWKENLSNIKDDFEEGWEATLTTAKDVSKRLGEKLKGKTSKFVAESKSELVDTYENWVQKLQSFKNRDTLTTEELSSLLWKKAGRDIYDNDGELIIAREDDVTPEVLEKVQQARKTKELLLAIAMQDVADKLETIEKESEGL